MWLFWVRGRRAGRCEIGSFQFKALLGWVLNLGGGRGLGRWGLSGRGLGRWGLGRRGAGFGGRGEDEACADNGEALLGEFGLEELVFRAGEEVGFGAGDGGDEVVDGDELAVEGSLLVGVGGQQDGGDGAGLFGDDGPEAAVVAGDGEGEEGVVGAGVEVGKEDGGGMRGQAGGGAAAVGGDVEEDLGGVGRGGDGDRGVVDGGAQLDVPEEVGRGELLGFGEVVVEALHGDADDRGGVVAAGDGDEGDGGCADGVAMLGDDEAAGLGRSMERGHGQRRDEAKKGEFGHQGLHPSGGLDTGIGKELRRDGEQGTGVRGQRNWVSLWFPTLAPEKKRKDGARGIVLEREPDRAGIF